MPSLKKFRPVFWRSLRELENTPEFREYVEREFPAALEQVPPNSPERRRFLQLMGASLSMAGAAGCRWHEDKLVPLSRRPEGITPGIPRRFTTAMDLDGVAVGLQVTSYDGRPIKVDGNPRHPESLGACTAMHQASVLGLYDPDRSEEVLHRGKPKTFSDFASFAKEHFGALRVKRGQGLAVLAERSSSPTLLDMKRRLLAEFPEARWTTYEPASFQAWREGSRLAWGRVVRTHLLLDRAKVVVSLDADVMSPTYPGGLSMARAFARTRGAEGEMSRSYAIESAQSHLGSICDHRLALRAAQIPAVAALLDHAISQKASPLPELGPAQAKPEAGFLSEPKNAKFLEAVVADLLANVGKSVVVAGPAQPAEVHALVHRLNVLLGNVGRTVEYSEDPDPDEAGDVNALQDLVGGIESVDTLLILGGNPVYGAPSDAPFGDALSKVETSIHLSLHQDETSARATWHLPAAHYLESWGDARSWDGTLSIVQPLIAPLFGGKSAIELLALILGDPEPAGYKLVRRTHVVGLGSEAAFRRALHDGLVVGSAFRKLSPELKPLGRIELDENALSGGRLENGHYELSFAPDPKVYDGRFANNGWLQELPGAFTKLAWDNAVLVPPSVAAEIGLTDGEIVELALEGRSIRLPGVVAPGQADGSLRVTLGYGRTHAGHVGGLTSDGIDPVGANAYALRSVSAHHVTSGASLKRIGPGRRLASTQDLYAIDQLGRAGTEQRQGNIVRQGTLHEYRENSRFVHEMVEHKPLLNLWVSPVSYEGHRWGMSIDLNRCMGCSACVTACQAENNIPVTGREAVAAGREMLWLRVDRYYQGEPEQAEVVFQPMPCQQCENAPCEQVCPVGATTHSHEGLNDMVYNRCIGTRYCSNNCPYKVRHFNYFNFNVDVIGTTPYTPTDDPKMKLKSMVFNPEVTVRSRGVMEKCTFCVQRIQNTKIAAKNERREIADGEIKTACQETCPTEAIVFGDLNASGGEARRQQNLGRSYAVLGELNNRPRVQYLARIKNTNPELG